MPPKRKSDAINTVIDLSHDDALDSGPSHIGTKKARVVDASEATDSSTMPKASSSKINADALDDLRQQPKPKSWRDIKLEGEDEGGVPIYDDCNDIRRKIRQLQKQPGFKVTHWLKEIGNVNSNSYGRFMKATGPTGGAGNSTYYCAYVYFEKVRIFEGKKKTPKRLRTEAERPMGLPLEDRSHVWVFTGRR
ncbi:hypothetical protein K474DRAFT_1658919 [Panus rudis PR-1116 ss-1]|nr:hypothetical protein K474DRAFT_1658919 [Panus rudis PR-1116 ss-1]